MRSALDGWLLFGLIAGLGLQNKLSMGFFGLGLCVALVLTSNRKYIVSKVEGKFRPGLYLWAGGTLAMLIFLPHLIWQILNGWPTIEFMRNSIALHGDSPLGFLLFQAFGMHPFNLPIWLAGLYFYLFSRASNGGLSIMVDCVGKRWTHLFWNLLRQGAVRLEQVQAGEPFRAQPGPETGD
ncbi:MAG: glycosyltransferase family 39 protein [Acidobacteriota bacterium]